jgi:L-fuculose-phosphate aldolase
MKFQALRQRVVDMSVMLADRGYFAATGGNLALRADEEHIVVTPSATDYYQMSAADVSVLRLNDLVQVDGERKPSVETGMHAKVLRRRGDCQASIHTHQPAASACTLLGINMPVTQPEQRLLLGSEVLAVRYAPSGTGWLSSLLAKTLRPDVNAYLLRTHGAICCAPSPRQALQAISALEQLATDYLRQRIAAQAAQNTPQQNALQHLIAILDANPVPEMSV